MGARRAWAAVILLTLVGLINQVDRLLPGILIEPIKHDLHLSDTALGLINGFGFLLVYSIMGIPIARLSDRGAYGLVIATCLAVWSAMTIAGSMAQNGWQLALSRMGVALGEAGNTPATHAFIALSFSPQARALPLSIYGLSVPLAAIVGKVAAGQLAGAYGWRTAFVTMGVAGLALVPLVLLLLGSRQAQAAAPVSKPAQPFSAGFALLRKRSYLLMVIACSFIGIGGYAIATFVLAFLMRSHAMPLADATLQYGPLAGIIGMAGVLGVGTLADRLARHDPRWSLWLVVVMIAVLAPCLAAGLMVKDPLASMVLLALGSVAGSAYLPPVVAAIQAVVPADTRATASAMMLFFTAMAGGLGPLLVGIISDALMPGFGQHALAWAMLAVPAMFATAGLIYFAASLSFRSDMEDL